MTRLCAWCKKDLEDQPAHFVSNVRWARADMICVICYKNYQDSTEYKKYHDLYTVFANGRHFRSFGF